MKICNYLVAAICLFIVPSFTVLGAARAPAGWVNVMTLGAKGDGNSDDAKVIQAALNASRRVLLPAGVYRLDESLVLNDEQELAGEGARSVLKAGQNGQRVITGNQVKGFVIRNLAVDGGGQTEGIYAGVRGVTGIALDAVSDFRLEGLRVYNCGVANPAGGNDDRASGGFGIAVTAIGGPSARGLIVGCMIDNIAGAGNFRGDGIYIAGGNEDENVTASEMVVSGCRVAHVGRHAYTIAGGGDGTSMATRVKVEDSIAVGTALAGVDVECGTEVIIRNCIFTRCGNDISYYQPVEVYGKDYRLCAAIATTNENRNISVVSCYISDSYFGITYGATTGFLVADTIIERSDISDLAMRLARGPSETRFLRSKFLTRRAFLLNYNSRFESLDLVECDFGGRVNLSGEIRGHFIRCVFRDGIAAPSNSKLQLRFTDCILNSEGKDGRIGRGTPGCEFIDNSLNHSGSDQTKLNP